MSRTKEKHPISTDRFTEEMNKLVDIGLDIPLRLTKVGVSLVSDSICFLQDQSKKMLTGARHGCDCDCDWCDSDCWNHEFCSCCYTSDPPTDLWVEARMGEVRIRKFVIENNRDMDVTVFVDVVNLMDACGNKIDSSKVVVPYPKKELVIPACTCIDAFVAIILRAPLKANNTYYAEIVIKGDCAPDPITLGFHIEPEDVVDHLVLYDPCRPQKGRFVEFESCCICGCSPCTCGCSKVRKYYICPGEEPSVEDNEGNEIAKPIFDSGDFIESVTVSKKR